MPGVRLFEEKKQDQIISQYQTVLSDLFVGLQKTKYQELSAVLKALLCHDRKQFITVLKKISQENDAFDYQIPDYRNPRHKSTYKFPIRNWHDGLFGQGKTIRKILRTTLGDAETLHRNESEYVILKKAFEVLNKVKDAKDSNVSDLWIDLKNIKLELEDILDPKSKNKYLFNYYNAVIHYLTELFFIKTIQGLSSKSLPINFSQMLIILVHGDEDMIMDALINNGYSKYFSDFAEQYSHIFRESLHHFEQTVNFMDHKKSSDKSYRHDYFEIIPAFIKKCEHHQHSLIIEEFNISKRELSEDERMSILGHHKHSTIEHRISKHPKLSEYVLIYFSHDETQDIFTLPNFEEYCQDLNRPISAPSAKAR